MRTWLFLSVMMMPLALWAQPDSLWSRTFGGQGIDICKAMLQTADQGYIMAGTTLSYGAGEYDMWLVKTDSNGIGEFSRTFGGAAGDGANAVCQTPDGGYILAGWTYSFAPGSYVVGWIVKVGPTGDSLWSRTWDSGLGRRVEFYSVQPAAINGLILAGMVGSMTMGNASACLVRTDALGNPLWSHSYSGSGVGYFTSVIQLSDGSFVACGTTGNNASATDGWAVKTDAAGNLVWSYPYDAGTADILNSVTETTDGGFLLAGSSWSNSARLWIARLNSDGYYWGWPPPWMPSPYYSGELTYARELPDGTWMATGTICCAGNGSDFLLVGSLGFRTYGDDGPQQCYASTLTSDGGYALAGSTVPLGIGHEDFYLLKTRSEFSGTDNRVTPSPASFDLTSFPNPFNPSTEITYTLPAPARVSLRVFDLLGRELAVLKDGFAEAGSHVVTFDGGGLASGIYIGQLQTGNHSESRKLVLLK